MSYFKSSNNTSSNNTSSNNTSSNSDLYRRKTFVSNTLIKPVVYNHQDNQFPDLFVATSKGVSKSIDNSTDYVKAAVKADITVSTVASIVKAYEVPQGATQYTFYKATGKTTVAFGKKSISDLERDKLEEQNYIGETIIKELSYNWKRYKKEYDGLHGPNSYDDLYHTEPIYPYLDEEFFISE